MVQSLRTCQIEFALQVGTLVSDSHLVETRFPWNVFDGNCPRRLVLDRIADKWTVLIIRDFPTGLYALPNGP